MKHELHKASHSYGQAAWVDPQVGWDRVSGDLQGGSNCVSQVDGVSDMAPACQLCGAVEGGLRKGAMASACPDARHFSLSQYATGALLGATLALELRGSESE